MSYWFVDPIGGGLAGDVDGPASSTDNAVARFDSTTGKIIQNSVVLIGDTGIITGVLDLTASGTIRANTAIVLEETGVGTDTITLQAPASITASYTLTLPDTDGGVGEFLQTDGSGVTVWATPAGTFDASVGATGADYTTISAALAASKSRLLVLNDVTETADCAIPAAGLYIYILKGKTLAMGAFQFTCAAARRLSIVGQDQSSAVTYGYASEKYLVNGSTFVNHTLFDTLSITNTSAVANCYLLDGSSGNDGTELYRDLKITLPDVADGGIHFWSDNGIAENIHLVGGGTTCSEGISNSGKNQQVSNLRTSGTWIASASGAAIILTGGTLDGFFIDHAGDTSYTLAGNLLAGNISLNGNGAMTTTVLTINASVKLSNVDLTGPGSGTRTISIDGSDVCLSNFLTGVLTLSTSRSDLKMTNGEVTSACTINGDRYCFTNVKFIGGATVPTGQDNNGFINCQFGADAGGGALTLTIDAGANNTRVLGSMSDAAISDAGTGTVTLGNTVY